MGCARWGKSSKRYERIAFNPGAFDDSVEDYNEPTALGYCNMHSRRKTCNSILTKDQTQQIALKSSLVSGGSFRNLKRHRQSQSIRCNKTIYDRKPAHICDSSSEETEIQMSYDGEVVVTDEESEDKQSSEKWSHLWVPNYRPDPGYFFYWDNMEEISQEDIEGW